MDPQYPLTHMFKYMLQSTGYRSTSSFTSSHPWESTNINGHTVTLEFTTSIAFEKFALESISTALNPKHLRLDGFRNNEWYILYENEAMVLSSPATKYTIFDAGTEQKSQILISPKQNSQIILKYFFVLGENS